MKLRAGIVEYWPAFFIISKCARVIIMIDCEYHIAMTGKVFASSSVKLSRPTTAMGEDDRDDLFVTTFEISA